MWEYRFLQDIEEKILSMYAKGMTTGDIEAHIQDIYGIEVSDTTVSRITGRILPVAREWQQRPLEAVYAAVDEQTALTALDAFSERWDKKYPNISVLAGQPGQSEHLFQVSPGGTKTDLYH